MDLLKMMVCLSLALVLLADVMLARPLKEETSDVENFIDNLQTEMEEKTSTRSRRRRRHTMTRDLAIMEFCIRRPHRCRQKLRELENQARTYTVVVIAK